MQLGLQQAALHLAKVITQVRLSGCWQLELGRRRCLDGWLDAPCNDVIELGLHGVWPDLPRLELFEERRQRRRTLPVGPLLDGEAANFVSEGCEAVGIPPNAFGERGCSSQHRRS